MVIDHLGGSYCKRLLWANSGYQMSVSNVTSEACSECVIEIGGEGDKECDAGGWAQNNSVSLSFLDNRSMTGDLLRIGCDATVSFGKNKGTVRARCEDRTASLTYSGSPTILTTGKWNLFAQGVSR